MIETAVILRVLIDPIFPGDLIQQALIADIVSKLCMLARRTLVFTEFDHGADDVFTHVFSKLQNLRRSKVSPVVRILHQFMKRILVDVLCQFQNLLGLKVQALLRRAPHQT